ncbi:protein shisa-5 isoform X4 [Macaca fascicularis]|uniref:protein shisa-5 isoform X4 n=1 Tax=Macaca fascicularis TaxID=9541 RepID=UPI003D155C3B
MAAPVPALRILLLLLLLLPPPPGAHGEVCTASHGLSLFPESCPDFCCGTCYDQYCCSDVLKKFVWTKERCAVPEASVPASVEPVEQLGSALRFRPGYSDPMLGDLSWDSREETVRNKLPEGHRRRSGFLGLWQQGGDWGQLSCTCDSPRHEAAGWSLDSDGSTYAWPRTPAAGGCHPWQGL